MLPLARNNSNLFSLLVPGLLGSLGLVPFVISWPSVNPSSSESESLGSVK